MQLWTSDRKAVICSPATADEALLRQHGYLYHSDQPDYDTAVAFVAKNLPWLSMTTISRVGEPEKKKRRQIGPTLF